MFEKISASVAKCIAVGALAVLAFFFSAQTANAKENAESAKNLNASKGDKATTLKVLFTADLHSCVEVYPQLVAFVNSERDKAQQDGYGVITVDAGGMTMGTVYSAVTEIEAAEYRALALMGCDAFVFGNHDFDLGVTPLAYMFYNAHVGKKDVNPITGKKLRFPDNVTGNIAAKDDDKIFGNALKYIGKTPYIILDRGNVKVGIFGLYGKNAYNSTLPKEGFKFEDPLNVAKVVVNELKTRGVDFIVCLSHSGSADKTGNEDVLLAKMCPDIDLIVSGHSHEALYEPYMIGNVAIASAGANGRLLGEATLSKVGEKSVSEYELKEVPVNIKPDPAALALADSIENKVAVVFGKKYGCFPYDVVTYNFTGIQKGVDDNGVNRLAYEVAKSMYNVAAFHSKANADTSALVALVPGKLIESSLGDGPLSYADVFKVLPMGRDSRGNIGYPLVVAKFTGKELKLLCELNSSVAEDDYEHHITFYGLDYTYDPAAMKFFRVRDVMVHGKKVTDSELYTVVADANTISDLSTIGEISKGVLKFVPKNSLGKEVRSMKEITLKSAQDDYMQPLYVSQWFAFAQYIKNNVNLPDMGTLPAGVVDHSFVFAYGRPAVYVLIAVAVVCGVVFLFARLRKKRKTE